MYINKIFPTLILNIAYYVHFSITSRCCEIQKEGSTMKVMNAFLLAVCDELALVNEALDHSLIE